MKTKIATGYFDNNTPYVKLTLNPKIYSLPSIYAASYIFLDRAYILLDYDKDHNIEVYLSPKNGTLNLKDLGLAFSNELVNYLHYFSRVESNAGIIKTIMQRVLFSVNPKFAEEAEEQEIQELLKELEKEEPAKKTNASAHPKKKK